MESLRNSRWTAIIIAGMWLCMTALYTNAALPAVTPSNPTVVIQTSMGDITVELYPDKAPKTVENFLSYVKDKHYRGTIFHRVIKGFMIQGGGFTPSMSKKRTKPPIPNEAANGLKNDRGTIAMARTTVVDSATAQFFINVANNDGLNHRGKNPKDFGYAVFGKVIAGMEVVDKIEAVATGTKGAYSDVPNKPVIIKNIALQ